jgi:hypothetical protein
MNKSPNPPPSLMRDTDSKAQENRHDQIKQQHAIEPQLQVRMRPPFVVPPVLVPHPIGCGCGEDVEDRRDAEEPKQAIRKVDAPLAGYPLVGPDVEGAW